MGQARKSLWIETWYSREPERYRSGQARKSLWIETYSNPDFVVPLIGQARKSLWIETECDMGTSINTRRSGS